MVARAFWLTLVLVASAFIIALPGAAAPAKAPRWIYAVNFVEGEATFTWSGTGGDAKWEGTAKVTFFSGALKGKGFLDLGLGGGTVRSKVTTTWTEPWTVCGPEECRPAPCQGDDQKLRTEKGGLSFKVVDRGTRKVVNYTWNFPQVEPLCSGGAFWPLELGETKLKQGKMTQSAPLSTFAKRAFTLELDGSDGYRGGNPAVSVIGTYTWHATVRLARKK